MLSLIHAQKGFDFWGTKAHHWHEIPYRGFTPIGPTAGLPRPRYFTPGRYSEGGYGG